MDSVVRLAKDAGPFAFLCIAAGAVGLLLALATAALGVAKSPAARWAGIGCLLCAIATLAAGQIGHSVVMVAVSRSMDNVPFDMRELLLRKGTAEARANYVFALAAAALPLLAGVLASILARFRIGLAVAALALMGFGAMAFAYTRPLPPLPPEPIVPPPGLELPRYATARAPRSRGLLVLATDGLTVEGKQTPTAKLSEALRSPNIKGHNSHSMPLMVDRRVPFSALADVLRAAQPEAPEWFELAVLDAKGSPGTIPFKLYKEVQPRPGDQKPLALTLTANTEGLTISASGGTLPLIPLRTGDAACPGPCFDFKALNDKVSEIKAAFPDNREIRVKVQPDLPVELLAPMLGALRDRDGKIMHDELLVVAGP